MNTRAALGCGDPREYRGIPCWKSPHIKHPKSLVAEAVDNMQADSGFGVLGPQPSCISPNLFCICFLKSKFIDSSLHFGKIGIGIILELYNPASTRELFMKFSYKLQIAFALGIGAFYRKRQPG
jgi:hypothetical protein